MGIEAGETSCVKENHVSGGRTEVSRELHLGMAILPVEIVSDGYEHGYKIQRKLYRYKQILAACTSAGISLFTR